MFRLRLVSFGTLDFAAENFDQKDGLLKSIGAFFQAEARRNLETKGRSGGEFAPRMVPNIPGIISDLRDAEKPKKRRFEDSPVPFDTGDLWKLGAVPEITGKDEVTVGAAGTVQAYADVQHFGGESESDEITQQVVDRLTKFLDKGGKSRERRIVAMNPEVKRLVGQRKSLKETGGSPEAVKLIEKSLKKARKDVRKRIASGPKIHSEWFDELGWLANDRYVGTKLTIQVRPRPWLEFSEETYSDLRSLLPEAILTKGGNLAIGGKTK